MTSIVRKIHEFIEPLEMQKTTSTRARFIAAAFGTLFIASASVSEAGTSLIPSPSVVDYSDGNGWASGVGIQLESSAVYRGSDHSVLEVKPEGAVQWRSGEHMFFWEGYDLNDSNLGWRSLLQNTWLIEGGARHEIVIPSSRSEKAGLENLPHRGSHILGFFEARRALDSDWKNWVSSRFLFGSNEYGWQSKLSAGHRLSDGHYNNGTELVLFSTFASQENKNNYFGINEEDAAATGLQEIGFEGGYRSSGLNVVYRKYISKRMQLTAKAGIEFYSSDIEKSELVRDATETSAELSLVWR